MLRSPSISSKDKSGSRIQKSDAKTPISEVRIWLELLFKNLLDARCAIARLHHNDRVFLACKPVRSDIFRWCRGNHFVLHFKTRLRCCCVSYIGKIKAQPHWLIETLQLFFSLIVCPSRVDGHDFLLEPFEKFVNKESSLSARDFCLALSLLLPPTFTATSQQWKSLVEHYSKHGYVDFTSFIDQALYYHQHSRRNLLKPKHKTTTKNAIQSRVPHRSQENTNANKTSARSQPLQQKRGSRSVEAIRPKTVLFDPSSTIPSSETPSSRHSKILTRRTRLNVFNATKSMDSSDT